MNDVASPIRPEDRVNAPGGSRPAWQQAYSDMIGSMDFDLRGLLMIVWRRRYLLLASIIVVTTLAWLQVNQMTPRYTAAATVLIETRESRYADMQKVMANLGGDPATIESETEVMRSRPLAEKVIGELQLAVNPEFDPTRPKPRSLLSYLNPLTYIPSSWSDAVRGADGGTVPSVEEKLDRNRVAVTDAFLSRLNVENRNWSRIIDVSFESENPRLAATVVNAVADAYVTNTLEVKFQATQQATNWLNERLAGLREAVERSERAVERYRKSAGLIEGRSSSLSLEQTSALSSELVVAQADTARAEARLRQIQGAQHAAGVSEVLNSPLIQSLRQQEAELQRREAELATEYGDKHPKMVNIRAEMSDLRRKISVEINKIVDALRNEVQVARAKEESLRHSLAKLNSEAAKLNEAEVELHALQREADANRLLLENFLNRYKETSVQADIQQPDARVISRAEPPQVPSYPKKGLILGLSFAGSVFLGLILVLLVEHFDAGVRKSDQLEALTGLPVLGMIPTLSRWSWNQGRPRLSSSIRPEDQVLDRPGSVFSESIRTLHLNLTWTHADKAPKVVVVTSALPGEGKSSLSMALARARAKSGDKVLLLDCDLRRPSIAAFLDLEDEPGLSDYLFGRASLSEVVQVDEETGCHVIAAGHHIMNPVDMVDSKAMGEALITLRETYDLVLIDTSPLLAVTEPRLLAKLADTTILMVRWGTTPREVVRSAVKVLRELGVPVAGTVLSQVDLKQQASYGYGQYGHYYRRAQKYYTS
jgi:succinoglycan biosynthesis transport protein ExoP